MGRSATGVKGIQLDDNDTVIDMDVIVTDKDILIVTSKGYGKRTPVADYRIQNRGGKGIKTLNVTDKNGPIVSLKVVENDEDLMIMTASGTMIRTSMEGISTMGRNTQGVRLINTREDDTVATVTRVARSEDNEVLEDNEESESGESPIE
jgi:DNA gyrase subunit A